MAIGKIPLIGVPGSVLANVTGQAVAQAIPSTFVPFVGSSLNQIAGGASQAALNVGISSVLGSAVAGQSGFDLTAGQNFLASQVTPFLTNTLAQGVNVSVTNALQGAGPLAPVLGNLAGQVASNFAQTIAGGLGLQIPGLGGADSGNGPSRAYPGAGGQGEEPADYNGNAYNLGNGGPDVVFSILPANSGPQNSGVFNSLNNPLTAVTQAFGQVQNAVGTAGLGNIPATSFLQGATTTFSNDNPFSSAGITAATAQFGTATLTNEDAKIAAQLGSQPLDTGSPVAIARAALGGQLPTSYSSTTPNGAWTFIVSPEDISWNTGADVNRVPIFGSNQAPVIVGAKGMRELTLGNALVEGFTRGVSVEGKIAILEDMLNYELNSNKGYVNVPLYRVSANDKYYGAGRDNYDGGIFAIKEVRVKEVMRDLKGNTTRATVDISLTQVPPYQVDSGRDQADLVSSKGAQGSVLFGIRSKLENLNAQVNGQAADPSKRSGNGAPSSGEKPDSEPPARRPSPGGGAAPPKGTNP